jgi:hypothetical protein
MELPTLDPWARGARDMRHALFLDVTPLDYVHQGLPDDFVYNV